MKTQIYDMRLIWYNNTWQNWTVHVLIICLLVMDYELDLSSQVKSSQVYEDCWWYLHKQFGSRWGPTKCGASSEIQIVWQSCQQNFRWKWWNFALIDFCLLSIKSGWKTRFCGLCYCKCRLLENWGKRTDDYDLWLIWSLNEISWVELLCAPK